MFGKENHQDELQEPESKRTNKFSKNARSLKKTQTGRRNEGERA